MDAGVPLKAPVAGVAMGLIKEGDDYTVLTDIAGVEDHLGDMDFKVAGTENGITALQMDIKITGVTFDILRDALTQAREGRAVHPRQDARGDRRAAQRALGVRAAHLVDPDRSGQDRPADRQGRRDDPRPLRGVRAQIDVEDDGTVRVYAQTGQQGDALIDRIRSMTKEVEVGDEFQTAKVVKTTTFGAFVELAKGTDGLLHISNVSPGQRVGDGRGGPQQGRRDLGPRGRGRQGARPDRPAPRRGPGHRRQDQGGAGHRRHRRPDHAAADAATAGRAATAGAAGPRRRRRPRPRPRRGGRAATGTRSGARSCPSTSSPRSTRGCGSSRST